MATPLSPRRYEVRITATAEEDLDNILRYIVDQDAPLNAATFINRLRVAIAELAVMPNRWPRAREGLIAGIEGQSQQLMLIPGLVTNRPVGPALQALLTQHGIHHYVVQD